MTAPDRRAVIRLAIVIGSLLIAGWGIFFLFVAPQHIQLGATGVFGLGLAATAFLLGVRHAFDPDHIAAINNTTRRLISDGRPSISLGLWFALGHSTVVVVTVALLTTGVRPLAHELLSVDSPFGAVASFFGLVIAGAYLLVIGTSNLGMFRRMLGRRRTEGAGVVGHAHPRGLMSALTDRLAGRIDQPWKIYPIGLLFGLGFDTASTIGLLVLGGGLTSSAPWWAALVVPLLFTAGMCTFDALDGVLIHSAHRWADLRPKRRRAYDLGVTGVSIFLAFGVGLLNILSAASAAADAFRAHDGNEGGLLRALRAVAGIDIGSAGFVIVGALLLFWPAAMLLRLPFRRPGRRTPGRSLNSLKPNR